MISIETMARQDGVKSKDLQSMQKYAACYWAQTAWL